jgi:hypothetical protein
MVPDFLHEAPPTDACAAFIKESRMKSVNASNLDRKSGCTLKRTWGTPSLLYLDFSCGLVLELVWTSSLTGWPISASLKGLLPAF